jgi:hypothetical protein
MGSEKGALEGMDFVAGVLSLAAAVMETGGRA